MNPAAPRDVLLGQKQKHMGWPWTVWRIAQLFFCVGWGMLSLGVWPSSCCSVKSLQSCPTLWDPMDCSLPGSSVHGILQAEIVKWLAISSSRGPSWPRDRLDLYSCWKCEGCGAESCISLSWPIAIPPMLLADESLDFSWCWIAMCLWKAGLIPGHDS